MKDSQKLLLEAETASVQAFHHAIYPIYAFRDNDDPTLVGTAFAIEYKDARYLISAAHVIDNIEKAELGYGANGIFTQITGEIHKIKPTGAREDDPLDFAWIKLSSAEAEKIAYIPSALLDVSPEQPTGRIHSAVGFPLSKNKTIAPKERQRKVISPKKLTYHGTLADAAEYFDKREMTSATHLAIKHQGRSYESDGTEVNSFAPKGMSGGPMIDLGLRQPLERPFCQRISGVLIENDLKAEVIVAVRIHLVLDAIDQHY